VTLVFRSGAVADLKWFRSDYTSAFPEGAKKAQQHYLQTCRTLVEHPLVGHPVRPDIPVRELSIPRTPFSFVYAVAGQEIMILRVLDARAERPGGVTK
jgi:plasmid stabilization system protein ParE